MTTNHENYQYPLDETWSTAEIITVSKFYQLIETANESSVAKDDLMAAYREFKTIVPAKSVEKQLSREFEAASGYSIYLTMKAAQTTTKARVRYRG
ncbi:UPF0223 family protein [Lactiplantibacillus mudanjiangensis]|uniref:Uncharacterized protein n=1 Tax=Lactiplantibacillus mudanjiangensis TaxID=1296538 RepID=A0A660E2W5_9LACO|nr:UPF0223 family protein [Lactiplantibacillus mudanjiangensis]VDG20734.1 hypothetical protein MUDAN_BIHEEGNE_02344 [Lactiplantibacillus mudanjiangensis]VDG23874.1 hypothetical protein MUDAN_IGPPGNFN_02394 [Lactiplantibacillus mudanjiangensis]VDG30102.1 hypothetical protein MUDAN_MDHGFNIF_01656 [Lactiplantibacillus mudanjiangensis]VDG30588.1 hypothetical protein MUDAN_DOGOELCO_00088 [Lactiplantibacillus mudanjiangensis]